METIQQRWSPRERPWPRGHILKSLALASKVKSLALKPQVLENWPVLDSRTALFFEWLKFCRSAEKFFSRPFFVESAWKKFLKTFFSWRLPEKNFWRPFFLGDCLKKIFEDLFFVLENTFACVLGSWPWECLFSEGLSLASYFVCVLGPGFEPCVLDSTSAIQ